MEIIKSFNVCDVDFDIYKGPVGISCSGGADSSILLYILMLHYKEPIHIFTTVSDFKQRKTEPVTKNVIKKCIELTGNSNVEHHLEYCDIQRAEVLFKTCKKWLLEKKITVCHTGITNIPPFDVLETFTNTISEKDMIMRDPNIKKNYMFYNFYRPFININKQRIADLYSHYQLIDNLYPITRSCEWIPELGDDPGLGHCGKCWWCEEREWGFKALL